MSNSNDSYLWIGSSGATWNDPSNWTDETLSESPAPSPPAVDNPVTIDGPLGASFLTIDGGGASASLSVTGSVALSGIYTTGILSLTGTVSPSSVGTTGTTDLTLDAGAELSASSGISITGSVLSLGSDATLVSGANVTVESGILRATGSGAVVTVAGNLTLNGVLTLLDENDTVDVSGSTTFDSGAEVALHGGGSLLRSTGTLYVENSTGVTRIAADDGLIQAAGLSVHNTAPTPFVDTQYTAGIGASSAGAVEIGTTGGATPGEITVDTGATLDSVNANMEFDSLVRNAGAVSDTNGYFMFSAGLSNAGQVKETTSGSTDGGLTGLFFTYNLINNGTVQLSGGTLSLDGLTGDGQITVSDQGTLLVGATISAGNTISFAGAGCVLEVADATSYQPASIANPVGAAISGLVAGDTIFFDGTGITSAQYTQTAPDSGTLTVLDGTKLVESLTLAGDYTEDNFGLGLDPRSPIPGFYDVVDIACFCAGTLIATRQGEVPVESLAAGDLLVTYRGAFAAVRWIGFRRVDFRAHDDRAAIQPVRVRAGAFGAGLPRRDLLISPEHAVFVDGVLIPARHLVGCRGIELDMSIDVTTYYHIELPTHDVILAEGLPCESWLDTGNRSMFENADMASIRFDERRSADAAWARLACAPIVTEGAALDAVRDRVGAAATRDLRVDTAGRHEFVIEPGLGQVRLLSIAGGVPGDARRLGVAVTALYCDGTAIGLTDRRLGRGFHRAEGAWRWTDGAGCLDLGPSDRPRSLRVDLSAVAWANALAA